jgi:hypothetical protein
VQRQLHAPQRADLGFDVAELDLGRVLDVSAGRFRRAAQGKQFPNGLSRKSEYLRMPNEPHTCQRFRSILPVTEIPSVRLRKKPTPFVVANG